MRTCLAAIGLVVVLASASAALAARAPTERERHAITRAIKKSPKTQFVPDFKLAVRSIRVSTKGPWASATVGGQRRYRHEVQPARAGLRRLKGRWQLRSLGNGGGCDVPKRFRRELRLKCF